MPLVAVALVMSLLLHAGSLLDASALLAGAPRSGAPTLLAQGPAPGEPTLLEGVPASRDPSSSGSVVFDPDGNSDPSSGSREHWVAPHIETALWSAADTPCESIGVAHLWGPLQVVGASQGQRLPVWDPSTRHRGWVDARAVGPVDPKLVGTAYLPPIGRPVAWSGAARVTMYTCVELGGCAPTASGVWPEPGMVAVDPSVIPLGSTVWIQGLGTFLATDTGSMIRGAHIDVFGMSYQDAVNWGVQEREIQVFPPRR